MLPARLKLPVPPGSDHQDFTTDILLAQSNLQIDAFPFLVVWSFHFDLFECSLFFWDLTASGLALVTKEWYTKVKDPQGAKKTCISVIEDHPGFRPKN